MRKINKLKWKLLTLTSRQSYKKSFETHSSLSKMSRNCSYLRTLSNQTKSAAIEYTKPPL